MMSSHEVANDRIGPNAIIQVMEALHAAIGGPATLVFFNAVGLGHYMEERPRKMVSERDVAILQIALREQFGVEMAKAISWDAGQRTGDYLLANRIPALAQTILRWMPAAFAARVLAGAIARHSWTFAGSGTFRAQPGTPFVFSIQRNPICSKIRADSPSCDFYAATFERIFRAIVHPMSRVVETECESMGASACVFEVRW